MVLFMVNEKSLHNNFAACVGIYVAVVVLRIRSDSEQINSNDLAKWQPYRTNIFHLFPVRKHVIFNSCSFYAFHFVAVHSELSLRFIHDEFSSVPFQVFFSSFILFTFHFSFQIQVNCVNGEREKVLENEWKETSEKNFPSNRLK